MVGVEFEESHFIAGQLMHAGPSTITVTVGLVGTELVAVAHRATRRINQDKFGMKLLERCEKAPF